MRVLIVQLSDMHCKAEASKYQTKLTKAVESIRTIQNVDSAVLVFSGDLVNAASKNEYRAAKQLMGKFLTDLGATFDCFVPLMLVPGNHDMNLPQGCRTSKEILEWDKDDHLDEDARGWRVFLSMLSERADLVRANCMTTNLLL